MVGRMGSKCGVCPPSGWHWTASVDDASCLSHWFDSRLYEETVHLLEQKIGQRPLPNNLPATYRQVLVATRRAFWL